MRLPFSVLTLPGLAAQTDEGNLIPGAKRSLPVVSHPHSRALPDVPVPAEERENQDKKGLDEKQLLPVLLPGSDNTWYGQQSRFVLPAFVSGSRAGKYPVPESDLLYGKSRQGIGRFPQFLNKVHTPEFPLKERSASTGNEDRIRGT